MIHISKNKIIFIANLFLVFTILALFFESIKFSGFIAKYLLIDVKILLIICLFFQLLIKKFLNYQIPKIIKILNWLFFLFVYTITLILGILEKQNYDNYVFSHYGILYEQLSYLGFFLFALGVINLSWDYLTKHRLQVIFLSPVIYLFFVLLVSFWPMNKLIELSTEDNLLEQSQFIILLIAFFINTFATIKSFSINKIIFILFLLISFILLFLAGEEIAWGERYFKYNRVQSQTLNLYREKNWQKELTIHNNIFFAQFVGQSYTLLGLYGGFAWIIKTIVKRNQTKIKKYFQDKYLLLYLLMAAIIPNWYLSLFYLPTFIYNYYQYLFPESIKQWSEAIELLLMFGIFFLIIDNYYRIKFYVKSKKSRSIIIDFSL